VEEEGVPVLTIVISDGGIVTVGQQAGAPIVDARRVVGISTENPGRDLVKQAAINTDLSSEATEGK
jgi:hypothetical protein